MIVSGWLREDLRKRLDKRRDRDGVNESQVQTDGTHDEPDEWRKGAFGSLGSSSGGGEKGGREKQRVVTPQERLREREAQDRQDRES